MTASLDSNPGSYSEFVEKNGLEEGPDAAVLHGEAIHAHRLHLVEVLGYDSLEALHRTPLVVTAERLASVGNVALQDQAS